MLRLGLSGSDYPYTIWMRGRYEDVSVGECGANSTGYTADTVLAVLPPITTILHTFLSTTETFKTGCTNFEKQRRTINLNAE